MTIDFSPSFARSLSSYTPKRTLRNQHQLSHFMRAHEVGSIRPSFGLQRLRPSLWEVRIGLFDRVLFWREGPNVLFDFVGTHDEVRRFLKHL